MVPEVSEATAVLSRTPSILRALLADLDPVWLHADEGPGTYSPFDVVGHLLCGERTDWIPRLRCILEHGEERPFEPFDRDGFRERLAGMDLSARLAAFESERTAGLAALEALVTETGHLTRAGTHPALGRVTLGQLLATWVVHDLAHLGQIGRTMSGRYRRAVGPWRAYLPILDDRRVR